MAVTDLGPRPKTFLPLRRVAASLGKVSHKKFGRLRLVPKSGLSAELLGSGGLPPGGKWRAKKGASISEFEWTDRFCLHLECG